MATSAPHPESTPRSDPPRDESSGPLRPPPWIRHLLIPVLLFNVALILFTWRIGDYPLWDHWEPKYAQAMAEMFERGDLVTPWYDGQFRWTKPILHYWALAVPVSIFGNDAFAVRLPSGIAGALGVLWLWLLLYRLHGWRSALIGAGVLATLPQYYFMARQAMPDMLFALWVSLALGGLALALFEPVHKRRWFALAYLCLGLALLTKGPLAGAIFLGAVLLFHWMDDRPGDEAGGPENDPRPGAKAGTMTETGAASTTETGAASTTETGTGLGAETRARGAFNHGVGSIRRFLADYDLIRGGLLALAVAAPWYLAMWLMHGDSFTEQAIVHENLQRFAEPIRGHFGTSLYYLNSLLFGMFPWSGFLPLALPFLWSARAPGDPERRRRLFYLAWFCAVLLILTAAGSKIQHYLLPAAPAVAALVAMIWRDHSRRPRPGWVTLALLGGLLFTLFQVRDFLHPRGDVYLLDSFLPDHRDLDWVDELDGHLLALLLGWSLVLLAALRFKSSLLPPLAALLLALHHAFFMSATVVPNQYRFASILGYLEVWEEHRGPASQWVFYGRTRPSIKYYLHQADSERPEIYFDLEHDARISAYLRAAIDPFLIAKPGHFARISDAFGFNDQEWTLYEQAHSQYILVRRRHPRDPRTAPDPATAAALTPTPTTNIPPPSPAPALEPSPVPGLNPAPGMAADPGPAANPPAPAANTPTPASNATPSPGTGSLAPAPASNNPAPSPSDEPPGQPLDGANQARPGG